jgi:hypothetical protein
MLRRVTACKTCTFEELHLIFLSNPSPVRFAQRPPRLHTGYYRNRQFEKGVSMNHRHIQSFLTVSAAFFALNAPLHAHAVTQGVSGATSCVAPCAKADISATTASKPSQQS